MQTTFKDVLSKPAASFQDPSLRKYHQTDRTEYIFARRPTVSENAVHSFKVDIHRQIP